MENNIFNMKIGNYVMQTMIIQDRTDFLSANESIPRFIDLNYLNKKIVFTHSLLYSSTQITILC